MTPAAMQREAALARANQARAAMLTIRRDLKAGRITLRQALEHPDAQPMRITRLLMAVPWWGTSKTEYALRKLQMSEMLAVGQLSPDQRDAVVAFVEGGVSTVHIAQALPPGAPPPRPMVTAPSMKLSAALLHRQLARDCDRWKHRAAQLERAIRKHQRDVQGPGPAADFGTADSELWAARERIVTGRAAA